MSIKPKKLTKYKFLNIINTKNITKTSKNYYIDILNFIIKTNN